MRQRPAHGAAVPDLRMRNVRHGFRQQRPVRVHQRITFQALHAGKGADAQFVIHPAHIIQRGKFVYIDQQRRTGDAEIHSRYQALSARQKLCLVPVLSLEQQCCAK